MVPIKREPPFLNQFDDLTWPEYKSAVGVNPSRLARGLKSMLHFSTEDGDEKPHREKLVGSAIHTLVWEPDFYQERFAIFPGERRIGKAYDNFCDEHWPKEILKLNEEEEAMRTLRAIRENREAMRLISHAKPEVSMFCEDNGLQCKGRIDGLGEDFLVDLKTTTNVEMNAFGRVFAACKYAAKLACYKRWAQKLGRPIKEVFLITAETKGDYDVAVVSVPDVLLDNAWPRVEQVMERIHECLDRDHWPGVAEGKLYELSVPNWSMDEEEILDWSE